MEPLTNDDQAPGCLATAKLSALVDDFLETADSLGWNQFTDFEWELFDPNRLSEDQRSAVSFITYIEDHLPGYFEEYQRRFPVDDSVSDARYQHNREFYHFSVRWAQEEDRHAHVLAIYQIKAEMATPHELRSALAAEGRKRFRLEWESPIEFFTYTLLQEKATQLFYQQFARTVDEPILQKMLRFMAHDEARHFAFFAKVVESYLDRGGDEVCAAMKRVVEQFSMPLADTLNNYWRWSVRVSDAVGGYEHTAAYEHLLAIVERTAESSLNSKTHELTDFIRAIVRV